MTIWVIASHNAGKVAEMRELLRSIGVESRSANELGLIEPEETGATVIDNALLKARAATTSGLPAIADDSGLVVPALNGAPGIYSARWAMGDWAGAMARVQRELGDRDRSASMVCALAIAWPEGTTIAEEGRVDGRLIWPPRGQLGFGYEPMFVPHGESLSYGEMDRSRKHTDDPRARAFAALRERLPR